MTTATADQKVEKYINTESTEGLADMFVQNIQEQEARSGKKEEKVTAPTDNNDVTASYQEKFTSLQKEGNIEAINKLRVEAQADITAGKVVDDSFLKQLELSAETPDQKRVRELTSQKETIENDLKTSEIEKAEALKKLEGTKEKKYWEEDPEFSGTPTAEPKEENDSQAIQEITAKAKKYEAIENDEFLKAYLAAKETGKSVSDFLTETANGNPASLTNDQILEKSIARAGLDAEEAEEQREHFKTMNPIARKEFLSKERAILEKDYQKNFEKYSTNSAAEREQTLAVAKKAISETKEYLSKLHGKENWGIVYDSTQINKLDDFARDIMENGLFRKDGTWDVPKIMQLGKLKLNSQHMLQKAFEKGQYEKEEEMYQLYGRPSKNSGLGKTPEASIVNKTKTENDAHDEQWKKDTFINS